MKRHLIWIVGIVLVAGVAVWLYWQHDTEAKPALQEILVVRGNLKIMVMTTGTVQPQNRLEIKPPIAGRIVETLVHEGDKVHKGQILAWMSSTERAALLDAARAKGATELAYWEQLYNPTPIVAPLDGNVIARNIEPGQTVTAQDILYVLSDRLIIEAQVDETDIGKISVGQPVDITLDAYPQHVITGKVDHIAFEATTVNNVTIYTVEVLPHSVPAFLRSGMSANLKVMTAITNQVLLLPTETVRTENNQTVVWQPDPADNDKPIATPIVIGLNDGKQTEIRSGLQENDIVLIKSSKFGFKDDNGQRNPFLPGRRKRRR